MTISRFLISKLKRTVYVVAKFVFFSFFFSHCCRLSLLSFSVSYLSVSLTHYHFFYPLSAPFNKRTNSHTGTDRLDSNELGARRAYSPFDNYVSHLSRKRTGRVQCAGEPVNIGGLRGCALTRCSRRLMPYLLLWR